MPKRKSTSPLHAALDRDESPEQLELLLELLQPRQALANPGHPDLPFVPKPPPAASPLAVGQDTALTAELLYRLVPGLRKTTSTIQRGPTRGTQRASTKANRVFDHLGEPLRGVYDHLTNEMHVAPDERGGNLLEVLAHEFAHGAGQEEGNAMLAGQLAKELFAREALEIMQRTTQ